MILLFPLCSNVNVYGFLHSSSSPDSPVIDRRASKEVVTREDIKEKMASSERAGKFSNIEHHGVACRVPPLDTAHLLDQLSYNVDNASTCRS